MELLTKHVMGVGSNNVYAIVISGSRGYKEENFYAMYNEEV